MKKMFFPILTATWLISCNSNTNVTQNAYDLSKDSIALDTLTASVAALPRYTPREFDSSLSVSILDNVDDLNLTKYDGITLDTANSCLYYEILPSQQHLYKPDENVYLRLVPKNLIGYSVSITKKRVNEPNVFYLQGVVERNDDRCDFN